MAFRLQHILLIKWASVFALFFIPLCGYADRPRLNNEYFEVGVDLGVLSIQDFNGESSFGANATFHATEDFFLQLNYFHTGAFISSEEASLNAFERSQRPLFEGKDRRFIHYGLLLGYNVFAGELFVSEGKSTLSNLYVVAGAGNVTFGGEESFSTTLGLGYKLGLTRRWNLRVDFRDHIYKSNLLKAGDTTHNTRFSLGVGFLF